MSAKKRCTPQLVGDLCPFLSLLLWISRRLAEGKKEKACKQVNIKKLKRWNKNADEAEREEGGVIAWADYIIDVSPLHLSLSHLFPSFSFLNSVYVQYSAVGSRDKCIHLQIRWLVCVCVRVCQQLSTKCSTQCAVRKDCNKYCTRYYAFFS